MYIVLSPPIYNIISNKSGRNLPISSKMTDICLQIKFREQRDYSPCLSNMSQFYSNWLLNSSIFPKWFYINFCPALSTNEITWNADFIFIEPLSIGPLTEIDTGPDIENVIAILSVVGALLKDNKV